MLYIPLRKRSVLVKILKVVHKLRLKAFSLIFMGICCVHIPVLSEIEGSLLCSNLIRFPLVRLPSVGKSIIIGTEHQIVSAIIKVQFVISIVNNCLSVECSVYRLIHALERSLANLRISPHGSVRESHRKRRICYQCLSIV